ncbi:MAG: ABC transporter ATP-binding protein [Candidatus Omnitrophota bacterium]|nr:ABC transporter ATP-binding protein [Candidatus Omnitrophota bacterium]
MSAQNTPGNIIDVTDLVKRFGDRTVLDGMTLGIETGKITVVMGGSGGGKSTLLRNLIGLLTPTSGDIVMDGVSLVGADEAKMNQIRRKFGMLFQGSALFNSMSVGDNVALPLREHTDLSDQIIKIIVKVKLELVGLTGFEDFMPYEISGGMKKRVALARAIALDPKIVFYDEPGAGLDPITASMIDQLILDLSQKLKITSVVVTHEMKSAFHIADKIIVLHKGKVIQTGTSEEIQNSKNPYVKQFISGEPDGAIPLKQTSEEYLKGLLET